MKSSFQSQHGTINLSTMPHPQHQPEIFNSPRPDQSANLAFFVVAKLNTHVKYAKSKDKHSATVTKKLSIQHGCLVSFAHSITWCQKWDEIQLLVPTSDHLSANMTLLSKRHETTAFRYVGSTDCTHLNPSITLPVARCPNTTNQSWTLTMSRIIKTTCTSGKHDSMITAYQKATEILLKTD